MFRVLRSLFSIPRILTLSSQYLHKRAKKLESWLHSAIV